MTGPLAIPELFACILFCKYNECMVNKYIAYCDIHVYTIQNTYNAYVIVNEYSLLTHYICIANYEQNYIECIVITFSFIFIVVFLVTVLINLPRNLKYFTVERSKITFTETKLKQPFNLGNFVNSWQSIWLTPKKVCTIWLTLKKVLYFFIRTENVFLICN
jgi:hypothetical protein